MVKGWSAGGDRVMESVDWKEGLRNKKNNNNNNNKKERVPTSRRRSSSPTDWVRWFVESD
jgi:hypothetical protein